ncbi:MAG: hypothetical protein ACLP8S_10200 [Solirubrobacteraceae bacterium]
MARSRATSAGLTDPGAGAVGLVLNHRPARSIRRCAESAGAPRCLPRRPGHARGRRDRAGAARRPPPAARQVSAAEAGVLTRTGRLVFYDWEADVLTPDGRTAAGQLRAQDPAALEIIAGLGGPFAAQARW